MAHSNRSFTTRARSGGWPLGALCSERHLAITPWPATTHIHPVGGDSCLALKATRKGIIQGNISLLFVIIDDVEWVEIRFHSGRRAAFPRRMWPRCPMTLRRWRLRFSWSPLGAAPLKGPSRITSTLPNWPWSPFRCREPHWARLVAPK